MGPGALVDGRYRVEREIGSGGMGQVFLARDESLDRFVAIKVVRSDVSRPATERARFTREAATMARLRSPHLASVHALGMHGESVFFVMEYVEGPNLAELLSGHGRVSARLGASRATAIVGEIAQGLGVAHAVGIVHRDVKPENVIIEKGTGRVVLVDFGIAFRVGEDAPDDRIWGTPHYLAPELVERPWPSALGDLYALGVLAYELLTGEVPFDAPTSYGILAAHRDDPVRPPSSYDPRLEPLDAPILRALEKSPEARFPTAVAFANALTDALVASRTPHSDSTLPPSAAGAVRVLVVDDEPLFSRIAARCAELAFQGVPVAITRAVSGREALASCERRRPDLVVLDVEMPGMDGVELLARLRELPGGADTRALVLSGAAASEEVRWRFSSLGVSRFVGKPLDRDTLVASIRALAVENGWVRPEPGATEGD